MGLLAEGLGLVLNAASTIPGARGQTIRRLIFAGQVYAEGLEAGVGNVRLSDGSPNPDFKRNLVRDVAAGIIGALVVEAAITIGVAEIFVVAAVVVLGAPIEIPAIVGAAIAAGIAYVLSEGIIAPVLENASRWLGDLFGPLFYNIDPLVLDLDGGGVSLTALAGSNVYFDLNNNNYAERTGWVSAGDGLLALDANRNGRIDNATELFGSATQNGFEALRVYDDNKDGQITAADAVWSQLLVWRDANSDGVSAPSELTAIAQSNVAAIALNSKPPVYSDDRKRSGNTVLAMGSYTDATGIAAEAIAVGNDNAIKNWKVA